MAIFDKSSHLPLLVFFTREVYHVTLTLISFPSGQTGGGKTYTMMGIYLCTPVLHMKISFFDNPLFCGH